jgi:hypothetical protein
MVLGNEEQVRWLPYSRSHTHAWSGIRPQAHNHPPTHPQLSHQIFEKQFAHCLVARYLGDLDGKKEVVGILIVRGKRGKDVPMLT